MTINASTVPAAGATAEDWFVITDILNVPALAFISASAGGPRCGAGIEALLFDSSGPVVGNGIVFNAPNTLFETSGGTQSGSWSTTTDSAGVAYAQIFSASAGKATVTASVPSTGRESAPLTVQVAPQGPCQLYQEVVGHLLPTWYEQHRLPAEIPATIGTLTYCGSNCADPSTANLVWSLPANVDPALSGFSLAVPVLPAFLSLMRSELSVRIVDTGTAVEALARGAEAGQLDVPQDVTRISAVGPVVGLTMTDAAQTALDHEMTVAHSAVMRMSLPYLLPPTASKQMIRVARFDPAIGKWTDAGVQTTLVGPQTVTALVSGSTLFTVLAVEANPPTAKSTAP